MAKQYRAFHCELEFPEVFFDENGRYSDHRGFDAVIGNPPWGGNIDEQLNYFHLQYPSSTKEHTDSFKLFVENNFRMTHEDGFVSMIVPNMLLRQRRVKDVRALLLRYSIRALVDLGEDVFAGVVAPSCIFNVAKAPAIDPNKVRFLDLRELSNTEKAEVLASDADYLMLDQAAFNENPDLEFMPPVKASSVPVVVLGKFSELECKDAGINYQRVKVGMQEKGKSDLAERLLYEGAKENHDDKMY